MSNPRRSKALQLVCQRPRFGPHGAQRARDVPGLGELEPGLQRSRILGSLLARDGVADEARELVDMYFEELRASLAVGEQVKLSGFGNFDLRDKKERPGRNPKTGEEIPISARRVVTFRPGQKLKARVEAYAGTGE